MAGSILVTQYIAEQYGDALRTAAPEMPLVTIGPGATEGDIETIEAAFFSHDAFPEFAAEFILTASQSDRLTWLHSMSAGVDHPAFMALQRRGVRITTSSGAHAVPIAQTAIMYMLALSRNLPGWTRAQGEHRWDSRDIVDLQNLTLGVVGMGPIGTETARIALALRMRVIGLRRTVRGDEPCETWPLDRLPELLPQVDYLLLALPLTADTRHILDAAAIAQMKPGACVLNVGRGDLIDETALIDALQHGHLGGAGLDVFHKEPLPEDSPLWDMANVVITPHSSGSNPGNAVRATEIFLDNLSRYARGEPLRNEAEPPTDEG